MSDGPSQADLVRDLERLEEVVSSWPAEQQATVTALRRTVEDLQKGAFRQMIRVVRESPGGLPALRAAVDDPWVYNVLTYHGLLAKPEPSLHDRVEAALESVRPTLAGHEGGVTLVGIEPPEVHIRLTGSCDGCAVSTLTVKLGIEKAVRDAASEIERVVVVDGVATRDGSPDKSPFEVPWADAMAEADVPEGGMVSVDLPRASVLLTKQQGSIKAYPNACPHLGMPLDTGELEDGILQCRYHGFRFVLQTGECITAPEVALPSYPVEVREGRVRVQVTG
ncbi:MAG: NifU family protein [Myxococcota bacterium]